jgi:pilus assembly protein CpaE
LRDGGFAARLDAVARNTLLAADEIVLVATPDSPPAATKNMLDVILRATQRYAAQAGHQPGRMPGGPDPDPGIRRRRRPAALLVLPFDPQLYGTAASNGQMIPEVQPALLLPRASGSSQE